MFAKLFASATVAHAHCDLYCGVYDPAQAKIEALSVLKTAKKYAESDDEVFRARCISIKEARAEETKHHLMVLWADFFAPDHFEAHPNLHQLSGTPSTRLAKPRRPWTPQQARSSSR